MLISGSTAAVLWVCIALFFVRVVGQIEVLLVGPSWLPPMEAWYSGLLPYPLLLPVQIALLMFMSVLAVQDRSDARAGPNAAGLRVGHLTSRRHKILRSLAILYFAVMATRLIIIVHLYGPDYYLHGAIPVAFHWVLALFVLVWSRR
jgi:hypothetical protein